MRQHQCLPRDQSHAEPVTAVTILGKTVPPTYDKGVTDEPLDSAARQSRIPFWCWQEAPFKLESKSDR
jgi:hypothetical protein